MQALTQQLAGALRKSRPQGAAAGYASIIALYKTGLVYGPKMEKFLKQLDMSELDDLSVRIDNNLFEIAELIFPHQPVGYLEVTERIGEWAVTQKAVLEFLASGDRNIAFIFDKICYRIWQKLPTYARCVRVDLSTEKH